MGMIMLLRRLPPLLLIMSLAAASARAAAPEDTKRLVQLENRRVAQESVIHHAPTSFGAYKAASAGGNPADSGSEEEDTVWPGAESALKHTTGRAGEPLLDPPPYGANLFARPLQAERPGAMNPDYLLAPGDQVGVHVWGAAQAEEVCAVDPQGNIFINTIGPVRVAGTRAGDLQRRVQQAVASVYTQNVDVYVNLLKSMPVEVFVTGSVRFPGQYAGNPNDSALTYLLRAGGIDLDRGSFRNIRLVRNGREQARFDLYRFLREGSVPTFRFQDGDVVMVEERGATVTVEGPTLNPFRFELSEAQTQGSEIASLTRPLPRASHVAISGNRIDGPFSVYVDYETFRTFALRDGDRLRFEADEQTPTMTVSVEGSYLGPSAYTVGRDTTLRDFLDHVSVDGQVSAYNAVYLRRASIARQQQELLDRTLRQLEQSVLTAPTRSDGEAEIRVREAELVRQFVQRAREVKPEGRVVVSSNGQPANIRLEPGDVVVIPAHTDVILIGGEVLMPQAIVHHKGFTVSDYVARSGGYTDRADHGRAMIIHQNGLVEITGDADVLPGDQVVILPAVEFKSLQIAKDIIQVLYQMAVSSAVVLTLL